MGSFTQLTYHIVFGTKYRRPSIKDNVRERLYEYIGGTIRAKKGRLIEIGGVEDHVHILAGLAPTEALANVVRDIKANSSKWMNEQSGSSGLFEWQKGYGAFTVSYSQIPSLESYLRTQEEHHRKKSFKEEYMEILKRHNLPFLIEHLFEGEQHG